MLYTSYFGSRKFDLDKSVSIALWTPSWYSEKVKDSIYSPLQPSKYLVTEYKAGNLTEQEYTISYLAIIENFRKITPEQVEKDLKDGTVMLSYEKSEDFCHRHIIREWLNKAGIRCEEMK